jgi:predicted Zn finger-like uncharacterized protein
MFTVCSKCNLRLTVTAADLRAAQGYVRCGHCHNVFNSLVSLADDPAGQVEHPVADTQRRAALAPPEPPAPEPAAPESGAEPSAADAALEFNPASTNISDVFIEAPADDSTGTFESIVLGGEEAGEEPQSDGETSVDEAEFMGAWAVPSPDAALDAAPPGTYVAETAPQADPLASGPPASHDFGWAQHAAVWALALCLIAQIVHHYRADLADTAVLQRPVTGLYQALGLPLEARWDIAQYEIRQLGATAGGKAAGDLVVRASISNRAARDQPLPLLRVVMQDRFGNPVAARDLTPAEYLGRGAPQVTLLAPGQRVDAQVAFQDPGQAATGFEIDACMAGHNHNVTCTNDPGSH